MRVGSRVLNEEPLHELDDGGEQLPIEFGPGGAWVGVVMDLP